MRVGHPTDPSSDQEAASIVTPETETKSDGTEEDAPVSQGWGLATRHFGAMMTKRYKYCLRDCRSWYIQIAMPIFMVVFGIQLTKVASNLVLFVFPFISYSIFQICISLSVLIFVSHAAQTQLHPPPPQPLELSTSLYNLPKAPETDNLPLPLPYTTGYDPQSTCSAPCKWWCEQTFFPWCTNAAEMCSSLHCSGCAPCVTDAANNPCGAPPSDVVDTANLESYTVQWWVDQLASITPHVTVEPSFQSNKVEYMLPANQSTDDEPYIALQNYLLRTGSLSEDKSTGEHFLVGGSSWKPIPSSANDMETCSQYLYR